MEENEQSGEKQQAVSVREARVMLWGPIFITLNLEKTSSNDSPTQSEESSQDIPTENVQSEKLQEVASQAVAQGSSQSEGKTRSTVNILSPAPTQSAPPPQPKQDSTKKVTYIYNMVDHGLGCDCIDVKGELLIRSALPTYRKISQGIEYEQISPNQAKIIITSRVLENYQEVFQGFAIPKATFRVWIMGYKVN